MTPALLAMVLLVCLIALLPVWRLNRAGWSAGALLTAWFLYAITLFAVVRFGFGAKYLVPILVVAYVAPFVAGPERLARLLGRRRERPVINVTPRPAPGLPQPPRNVTPTDVEEADRPEGAEPSGRDR
ncbi:MAG: hypothetical protein WCK58_09675 [Chloroflexota bacterium]